MNYANYHWLAWLITLVVALSVPGITIRTWWPRARGSFFWRFIICFFVVCLITPLFSSETFGGVTDTDVCPLGAALMFWLYELVMHGASGTQFWHEIAELMVLIGWLAAFSLLPAGIWSSLVKSRTRIAETPE